MSMSRPKPTAIALLLLEILLCVAIYLLCVCIRRRRRLSRTRTTTVQTSTVISSPSHVVIPRGLDPSIIATFPILPYNALVAGGQADKLDCAVCLTSFKEDETLRFVPKCEHVFHPRCVDPWLALHATCPYCRASLASPKGEVVIVVTVSTTNEERYTLRLSDERWREFVMGSSVKSP